MRASSEHPAQTLERLEAAGVIDPVDSLFARTVARLAGQAESLPLLMGAALVSSQEAQGSVCVDLTAWAGRPVINPEGEPVPGLAWPEAESWVAALRASPAVRAVSADPGGLWAETPLVLLENRRLYLQRLWALEGRLARRIRLWVDAPLPSLEGTEVGEALDALFGAESRDSDHPAHGQRRAALLSLLRPLVVLTGGPGTGKTTTVLRMMALSLLLAHTRGAPLPVVRLLAPTGKAAARLTEALRQGADMLELPRAVRDALRAEAATVHRALGASLQPGRGWRVHAGRPLPVDLCVVDEVSMVDLELMARLVDALPPTARLVLLGDRDQLASVQAGSVLGDLCPVAQTRRPGYAAALVRVAKQVSGDLLPGRESGASGSPEPAEALSLSDCVAPLTYSFRFRAESGVGVAAAAVLRGDAEALLCALRDPDLPDVDWWEVGAPVGVAPAWEEVLRQVVQRAAAAYRALVPSAEALKADLEGTVRGRLEQAARFRVLCAHRRGPLGVEHLVAEILAALRPRVIQGRHFSGRLVAVAANHYELKLWSGDVGLLLPDPSASGALRAYFLGATGALRVLSPARLPAHEDAVATTVHKAQGSEFDEVVVVLPLRPSPVTTRELLYTAITRARQKVTLVGTEAVLRRAASCSTVRVSGLRDRIIAPPLAGRA